MSTTYHAKYCMHELTKRYSADSLEKLADTVAGTQVGLNPHQVDAALFAFNSPLSKPWRYALIPHTAIVESRPLIALARQFIGFAAKEED